MVPSAPEIFQMQIERQLNYIFKPEAIDWKNSYLDHLRAWIKIFFTYRRAVTFNEMATDIRSSAIIPRFNVTYVHM